MIIMEGCHCCFNAFIWQRCTWDQERKMQKRVSRKGIEVRSSWQSEKVEMQRKESSNHNDSSFSVCSSREIGGKKIRGAGGPVIRLGRGGTASHICPL